MIIVKVPASSANLGIGFDCLAMAINRYNTFRVEPSLKWKLSGFDCDEKDNLFQEAYLRAMEEMHLTPDACSVELQAEIPISRGLGSSASLIVGGLMAANELHDNPLSKKEILKLASEMEGHPDNVSAAIFGNITLTQNEEVEIIPLHEKYHLTLWIPDFELSTRLARAVLPNSYPRSEVVTTLSSALFALEGLKSGKSEYLKYLMQDRIHEPYRSGMIPDFYLMKQYAQEKGENAFVISGSGSTCLSISEEIHEFCDLPHTDTRWEVVPCEIDRKGAEICRTNI